jgi:hypothetical protein
MERRVGAIVPNLVPFRPDPLGLDPGPFFGEIQFPISNGGLARREAHHRRVSSEPRI